MVAAIDRVAPLFDDAADAARLATLRLLVGRLDDDDDAQAPLRRHFARAARQRRCDPAAPRAATTAQRSSSASRRRSSLPRRASRSDVPAAAPQAAASNSVNTSAVAGVGRAASLGDFFSKAANAVANLLNLTTYFEMKKRAGIVGQVGVAPLLDSLASQVARIHLVGHSFGGRVVNRRRCELEDARSWPACRCCRPRSRTSASPPRRAASSVRCSSVIASPGRSSSPTPKPIRRSVSRTRSPRASATTTPRRSAT